MPDILMKLEQNEETSQLSAFQCQNRKYNRGQSKSNNFQKGRRVPGRNFCRLFQTAGEPERLYLSHNISSCRRWTRKDVEDLKFMISRVNPDDFDDSDSDE